jgi:transposase
VENRAGCSADAHLERMRQRHNVGTLGRRGYCRQAAVVDRTVRSGVLDSRTSQKAYYTNILILWHIKRGDERVMLLSFKTELKPNNKQVTLFRQHCGVARHAFNWGHSVVLETLKAREADKTIEIPSAIDLHKRLIAEVKPENSWYYESSKASPQQALAELRTAWERCFKKVSKQPRFKKKGKSHDSFYLEQGTKANPGIRNDGKRVKLPKIGWVRLKEELPITAFHNCVISRQADRWFIAFKIEVESPEVAASRPIVGVDIGIKKLAVSSTGKTYKNPKAYRKLSKRLKRLQRSVSRKVTRRTDFPQRTGTHLARSVIDQIRPTLAGEPNDELQRD